MAIQIKFDDDYNAIEPVIVLSKRNGDKLGKIFAYSIRMKDGLNKGAEMSFKVNKVDCDPDFWEQIVDFKLIWVRDWNRWFEIYVEIDVSDDTVKNVSAKSLGESELSQINLYNIEINTEDDIARDDYVPTVLYNEENPKASLLTRIMDKAPHYIINHVDSSIKGIQRTFSFDDKSIYSAFNEIAEEIECLFILNCYSNSEGNIVREVNVYDLKSYCLNCGERGTFEKICDKCGSTNVKHGYGDDTTIFVSYENLANDIKYSTDNGSVKNCFKLKAGDDLMTSTITNCNPNGSGYIWYISDETKKDMSQELVNKIDAYNSSYEYYQNEYSFSIPNDLLDSYNNLVNDYKKYSTKYKTITNPIVGYASLMEYYYDTIDFYLYLNNTLMPSVVIQDTTAQIEVSKLTTSSLSPVAVKDIASCSASTAESAVLAMAKTIVDDRYKVKATTKEYSNKTWIGTFTVTNYSAEEDTAESAEISCEINGDYEKFVRQRIEKTLSKSATDNDMYGVVELFKKVITQFEKELKKYSLSNLRIFHSICQSCIDILIEQGIANNETWGDKLVNLYENIYIPYYNKLSAIEAEIDTRESEIAIIVGTYDRDDYLVSDGVQSFLNSIRNEIQKSLNFENYLGERLWLEFVAYRREDTYSNDNYISDGLDNSELFKMALEFIEVAKEDIFKSATLQHSISATLKNLLTIKEFEPITEYFKTGNWLRINVDGIIYRLRILDYQIDYDNLENISVSFSDVTMISNGITDVEDILSRASDMSTSYGSISRQAKKGNDGKSEIDGWVDRGLALTKIKIIDDADNQNISFDEHGLLCKEYLPVTDNYDDKQLKLINRGLYLTDDGWRTSRAGIGDFTFWNPETGKEEETYGVVADTLIGNLILSEKVGVYNKENSITLDNQGLTIITNNVSEGKNEMSLTVKRKDVDPSGQERLTDIMYLDDEGNLVLNGSIHVNSTTSQGSITLDDVSDPNRFDDKINNAVDNATTILNQNLSDYQAEVGQYMEFGEKGLELGAKESNFKTIIDNQRISFMDGGQTAAYISNQQLYIPNATIQNTLTVGNFFFCPREDGGFSITYKG